MAIFSIAEDRKECPPTGQDFNPYAAGSYFCQHKKMQKS